MPRWLSFEHALRTHHRAAPFGPPALAADDRLPHRGRRPGRLVACRVLPFRGQVQPLTIGLTFLVIVVLRRPSVGSVPALLAALVSFLAFNFFFLPPYGTFVIARRASTVSRCSCSSGLSVLISWLYARAVERADVAEGRSVSCRPCRSSAATSWCGDRGRRVPRAARRCGGTVRVRREAPCSCRARSSGSTEREVVGAVPGRSRPSWNPADPGRAPERLPLSVGNRTWA